MINDTSVASPFQNYLLPVVFSGGLHLLVLLNGGTENEPGGLKSRAHVQGSELPLRLAQQQDSAEDAAAEPVASNAGPQNPRISDFSKAVEACLGQQTPVLFPFAPSGLAGAKGLGSSEHGGESETGTGLPSAGLGNSTGTASTWLQGFGSAGARGAWTPAPEYPEWARQDGAQGCLVLDLWIDHDGHARQAVVVKSTGSSRLDDETRRVILARWRFDRDGEAGLRRCRVQVDYSLSRAPQVLGQVSASPGKA